MKLEAVYLPAMGVNDIHAKIVEWKKKSGDKVTKGEILCSVETTKAIFDVEATMTGFITILTDVGAEVSIGDIIAVISDSPITINEAIEYVKTLQNSNNVESIESENNEIKITEKARLLALRNNVDITALKHRYNKKITEADVIKFIDQMKKGEIKQEFKDTVDDLYPINKVQRIAIIGGGDGAVQVIDAITKIPQKRAVMIFDDKKSLTGKFVAGVPIVGKFDAKEIEDRFNDKQFDSVIISISTSIQFRKKAYELLKERKITFTNVIHPSVVIGINSSIGEGNVILANCHIGACAKIGDNNFISAYCSIEHHNNLGNHCSFGPGVITSSKVTIGDMVRFGTGVFIEPHITIGSESIISSGCIIWKDIPKKTIAKSQLNYILRDVE